MAQSDEGADQKGGSDEEDEGEGDFADDEKGAHLALAEAGAGAVAAFFQGGVEVGTRGSDGGEEAEEDAGEEGDADSEDEDAPVEADSGAVFADAGEIGGTDGEERTNAGVTEDEAEDAAGDGEDDAFGEELADDAGAACSHSGADGELALAAGGADEEEIGDVGAGDEEDEADGSEENEEGGARVADDRVAERLDAEAGFWVGERIAAAELIVTEFELGVGLGEGDAGFETGGGHEVMTLVGAVGIDLEGEPEVGNGIGDEGFSDDAEDGVGLVAERERGADNVGVAAELALPEAVADDDEVAAVGGILLRREGAAEDDGRAEEAEVGFRDVDAVDLLRDGAGEVEAGTAEVVGGDVLEDFGLFAPEIELGRGSAGPGAVGREVHHLDDTVGVGIGEGLEEDGVDDGEDGGVGSDAERDGGDGGEGERRIGDEHAEGVAEVVAEIAHGCAALRFSDPGKRGLMFLIYVKGPGMVRECDGL